jgi:hypothetical protein
LEESKDCMAILSCFLRDLGDNLRDIMVVVVRVCIWLCGVGRFDVSRNKFYERAKSFARKQR